MEQMHYTLGLDIGIGSVGYAVLQNDQNREPIKIIDLGVRVFDRAEHPKDGSSLAAPRREARSARRRIRRRRHRKERIRFLIASSGLMSEAEMSQLFSGSGFEKDVYELRVEALDRALNREELVRLLIHYAQRRGYKSNSKAQEMQDQKETGRLHEALSANQKCMREGGYRTVGEMLVKDTRFYVREPDGRLTRKVHNSADDYKLTQERSEIIREIRLVLDMQLRGTEPLITREFAERYIEIFESQRNFDQGPGGDSPYGGSQIEKMWGRCSLEPEEARAAKASYTFEYFKLLQDMNHLRIVNKKADISEPLTSEQREKLMEKVMKSASLTYGQIRKLLELDEAFTFNTLNYGKKTIEEQEKQKFGAMQSYHKVKTSVERVAKGAHAGFTTEMLDAIGQTLSMYKSDDNRIQALQAAGIPEIFYGELLKLSFSKTGKLSVKAMQKMIPYLQQGLTYDKALSAAYGAKTQQTSRSRKLSLEEIDEDITNPVVRRAVSQSIKVINAVVRNYGPPEMVRIELARELGKNMQERDQITKRQEENRRQNQQLKEQIEEYKGDRATGMDIVKFKLYQQQDGTCLYSGKSMDIAHLFDAGYVDIDHIIPYSISYDDSYNNKVLVFSSENRMKGNRIPYDYLSGAPERWHRFEVLVNSRITNSKKRNNLLLTRLTEERRKGFRERNLVDTQYLSRVMYRLLERHLEFAETAPKRPVQTVNGTITSQVRKRLGLDKHREDGDLHHAQDAAVIACISPGMIQKITRYSQRREFERISGGGYVDPETGEILSQTDYDEKYAPVFPEPWPRFRQELLARMSADPRAEIDALGLSTYDSDEVVRPVFVSRMPRHKVTGAAHKETVRSGKKAGHVVSKVPLSKLKLNKQGEIEGYYNPESDRLLYEALKERLLQHGGKGEKAFQEPFYKPKKDGTPGPRVDKVKIAEKSTLNVEVHQGGGLAANGSMVRIDIFHVENDGYYAVPIYVSDTKLPELPNRAVVAHKQYEQWKSMDEADFLFSLYAGDLVYIEHKSGILFTAGKGSTMQDKVVRTEGLFYYDGLDISAGTIGIGFHDRSYSSRGVGIKSLKQLRKYQVDVLGNVYAVSLPEKRQTFR